MRAAAFFDLDGTLLQGESQFSFLIWCARRRIVPPVRSLGVAVQYASYLLGFSRDALRLRESGFNLLRGIAVERLEKAGVEFFHSCLTPRFRKQALPLIEAHRSRGDVIVLLTSACGLVASPVAEWMRGDAVIATNLIKDGGIFTGAREFPEPYGSGKQLLVEKFCAERGIPLSQSYAYTDHHSDAPLLAVIGNPFAVNPTKKLLRIAEEKRWPVLDLNLPDLPNGTASKP